MSTVKQREICCKEKQCLKKDNLFFKDLNANGKLDPYEDWRLDSRVRAEDLLSRMTKREKIGLLMIDTLNASWGGEIDEYAYFLTKKQNMRRFIFRNGINLKPQRVNQNIYQKYIGETVSPKEAAEFLNNVQRLCEKSRLGIPALFKSNARNHEEIDARFGINVNAGSFSSWPKEAGLAALRNPKLWADFARAMKTEWKAIGIRGMYGYMLDLATEPRWNRVHETFTEDAQLCSDIIQVLIGVLQGSSLNSDSIALTVKHFFGGGPQLKGLDPHYPFGKEQIYPCDNLAYHIQPFKAAIDSGVSSIMPYYGIPLGVHKKYHPASDVFFDENRGIAIGFNQGILQTLLREELGFKGNVNSDTGIIGFRPWGMENYSEEQRLAVALNAGIDVLSGFHDIDVLNAVIEKPAIYSEKNAYAVNGVSEERMNEAVLRLLAELFDLGLFENPYVDAVSANKIFHETERQRQAVDAQAKSIVVLRNTGILQNQKGKKVYLKNISSTVAERHGFKVVTNCDQADFAVIKILVKNIICPVYDEKGKRMYYPNGQEVDTQFGGAIPQESGFLSFKAMQEAESWQMSPSYKEIQKIFSSIDKRKIIVFVNFRQPYVIDEESGLREAGALSAIYGVSDEALFRVIEGSVTPCGKLPFSLPNSLHAVERNITDKAGYSDKDTLFPFGWSIPL